MGKRGLANVSSAVSRSLIFPYRIIDYWVFELTKSGSMRGAASQSDAKPKKTPRNARSYRWKAPSPLSAEARGGYSHTLSLCRFDDCQKLLRFEARAADERAVHVRLVQQRRGVLRFHASAVLYQKRCGRFLAESLADVSANEGMGLLRLLRRGVFAGADGPDRFVGHDHSSNFG